MWKVKTADALVGGLSAPSKMPCKSFSISAFECITGSRLRKIAGSVCSKCYALKGRYVFPKVQAALDRRLGVLARALADKNAKAANEAINEVAEAATAVKKVVKGVKKK